MNAACAVLLIYRKSHARNSNFHGDHCFVVISVDYTASIFHLHQILCPKYGGRMYL